MAKIHIVKLKRHSHRDLRDLPNRYIKHASGYSVYSHNRMKESDLTEVLLFYGCSSATVKTPIFETLFLAENLQERLYMKGVSKRIAE